MISGSRLAIVLLTVPALALACCENQGDRSSEPRSEYEAVKNRAKNAVFTAEYQTETESHGATERSRMIMYRKPSHSRVDSIYNDGRMETTILVEGRMSTCQRNGAQSGSCSAWTDTADSTVPEPTDLSVTHRQAVGEDATCTAVTRQELIREEQCFAVDGVLLRMTMQADGVSFISEATSVSRAVDDRVFDPPYPIND
jgi:hypothetical protein